jgi:hypothetical protein
MDRRLKLLSNYFLPYYDRLSTKIPCQVIGDLLQYKLKRKAQPLSVILEVRQRSRTFIPKPTSYIVAGKNELTSICGTGFRVVD